MRLTSTSVRDVKLNLVDLHVNPDYSHFITKVQKIMDSEDDIVLKTGESIECLFQLDIGDQPNDIEKSISEMMGH